MDFTKALDVKTDKIERPPLPPIGHYLFKVHKQPILDTVGKNDEYDLVTFPMQAQDIADEDVDQGELKKFGGLKMVVISHKFMFNKADDEESAASNARTLYNLKRFLCEHLGVEEGKPLRETIDAAVGMTCIANIQYRPDKNNPEVVYAEIGRTAPVE